MPCDIAGCLPGMYMQAWYHTTGRAWAWAYAACGIMPHDAAWEEPSSGAAIQKGYKFVQDRPIPVLVSAVLAKSER
jgi:hypothetical protein